MGDASSIHAARAARESRTSRVRAAPARQTAMPTAVQSPIQQPQIQQPQIQQPTIRQPQIQQPTIQQPAVQQPAIQQPPEQQSTIQPGAPPRASSSSASPSNSALPRGSQSRNSVPSPPSVSLLAPPTASGLSAADQIRRKKRVVIQKGFSQLDWARRQQSGDDLKDGIRSFRRITPTELREHRFEDDCWQAYNGKVYTVTQFLKYHPGGVKEIMRGAGADATSLHMKTHPWVNVDYMLRGCEIGFLVDDEDPRAGEEDRPSSRAGSEPAD